jgi:deoxyribonuclease V
LKIAGLIKEQLETARRVRITPLKNDIYNVAGADVAAANGHLYCSIGVFSFPDIELLEEEGARIPETIPYVTGFLSFRELPALVVAYQKLRNKPCLLMVDGQGIAHPRGLGLASHAGVVLGSPTIGCAKSHLYGRYKMPKPERGAYEYLKRDGDTIGLVLRTRTNVKPLFISPGHLVDVGDCLRIVLATTTKYRIPEPLRFAHRTAGQQAKSG